MFNSGILSVRLIIKIAILFASKPAALAPTFIDLFRLLLISRLYLLISLSKVAVLVLISNWGFHIGL